MILTTIYKSGEILKTDNNTVALGTFDGLHLAHMEIIKKAMQISKENKTKCGVMFFDSLPVNSFINSNPFCIYQYLCLSVSQVHSLMKILFLLGFYQ